MQQTKVKKSAARIAQSALMAAVMCILAPIAIPIGPIPVTMGTFAVMLCGVILSWRQAGTALLVYLCLGAIGLPVYSGGGSGFGVLAGPTGGYLWSFLPMAILISMLCSRARSRAWVEVALAVGACVLATLLCYLLGTWQFTMVAQTDWMNALSVCVYPFIPFDLVKAILASLLGVQVRRRLRMAGVQ